MPACSAGAHSARAGVSAPHAWVRALSNDALCILSIKYVRMPRGPAGTALLAAQIRTDSITT
eukprot:scaffold5869_cov148-Prasinococcus_capsulatus_cf.AAC.1